MMMRVFLILPLTAIATMVPTPQDNLCKAMLHNPDAFCSKKSLKCTIEGKTPGLDFPEVCCGQEASVARGLENDACIGHLALKGVLIPSSNDPTYTLFMMLKKKYLEILGAGNQLHP